MERVAIVGGVRTPFVRAFGALGRWSMLDLGMHVVKGCVSKLNLSAVDELVFGTVLLDPRYPNLAREIVIRAGLPKSLPAHFISNNCISGLVAATMVADGIKSGRIRSGLAGGVESMSRPSLSLRPEAEQFFLSLSKAKSTGERLKLLFKYRLKFAMPLPPSPKEPSTGLTMGEHCELTTKEWGITREEQDKIALKSHMNGSAAQEKGYLKEEIVAVGEVSTDNLIRKDTTAEKLAKLKPVFDRSEKGTLTAGNSSSLTDGASVVCLMAESEAKKQGREILGFIEGIQYAAVDPNDGLLMAPGVALPKLLEKMSLKVSDIDIFDIHEAFAAQVAANKKAWAKGWDKYGIKSIGEIPEEKINLNGGSIALGHPFAATGGRLILSTVNELKRSGKKRGAISVCAAGAAACAMVISRD